MRLSEMCVFLAIFIKIDQMWNKRGENLVANKNKISFDIFRQNLQLPMRNISWNELTEIRR